MAWYDVNRNRGYKTYSRPEPGYGRIAYPDHVHQPVTVDSEGRKHSVVSYTASHNSERYVAEQIVELRGVRGMTDHKHSPKDHGLGERPFLAPWSSPGYRPEKSDEYSPKVRNEVVNGKSKGSPRKNVRWGQSPPSRDHRYHTTDEYGKYNNLYSSDDSDDDDVICNDGNEGGAKPNHLKGQDYDQEKHKGNGYAPPYTAPASTHPRNDGYYQSSYPDKNEKQKETGYAPRSYTVPVSTQPRKETSYQSPYPDNTEKNKGNGHVPPYDVPASTQPRKEPYYETPHGDNTEKSKGNGYAPPSYNVPASTQPRKEPYYEASNNRPIVTNSLPLIKTKGDANRGAEFLTENNKNSPVSAAQQQQFNASPRKDKGHQEIIDSAEARRRYARPSPQAGAPAEVKYTGKIDSREAARKYNGVFVPM